MARQFWKVDGEEGTYLMLDSDIEPGMTDAKGLDPGKIQELFKGERVVVDSISSIILSHGIETALRCLIAGKDLVTASNANIMFTCYADLHSPLETIKLMRTSDIFIELKEVIFMNEIERQLAVHKMRKGAVPRRLIPFLITEKGIELSTTSRVV
ncbi:MAG: hypothetical protein LUQ25_09390 [Methanoregulaceae archaeon]|nr:hypothetical protein [Methanoregulaceae archaeon]